VARLFFALWPDAPAREALAALAAEAARRTGGRAVTTAKLHLTLLFLGEVDAARIPALVQAAAEVRAAGFDLVLDRLGAFARARVAWAGCAHPPAPLLALQSGLEGRLREAGWQTQDRAFAAHLTLVRNARKPLRPEAITPVAWPVVSFALVESLPGGGGYRTLAAWDLGGEKT
jgi:2'-5' RNA ligase